ncbi:MAG: 2Fe-2S iron-sulfur cluster binding domain-containing protein [Sphingomonadales bacterium]|nr:2Fe-2S iron-sulfur cluster binding domain-containing protein [Sphingomonadales bacterium]
MNTRLPLHLTLNGEALDTACDPTTTLAAVLRGEGAKTVRLGCEEGVCGSCTVLVDGQSQRACLTLAIQVEGAEVKTVESYASEPRLRAIQDAFVAHYAAQCGFCTSGMLGVVAEYLDDPCVPNHADEAAIRNRLNAVVCRCTGYQQIVEAVRALALARKRNGDGR